MLYSRVTVGEDVGEEKERRERERERERDVSTTI